MAESKAVRAKPATVDVEKVMADINAMVASVPVSDDGTVIVDVASQVLTAGSLDELAKVGSLTDDAKVLGRMLVVTGITQRPSDFTEGLRFYLVVDGYDVDTGEVVKFSTGAFRPVLMLVRAWSAGWFPVKCQIDKATKPTSKGYYPRNLTIYGSAQDF